MKYGIDRNNRVEINVDGFFNNLNIHRRTSITMDDVISEVSYSHP